jgi:hypothetical protein
MTCIFRDLAAWREDAGLGLFLATGSVVARMGLSGGRDLARDYLRDRLVYTSPLVRRMHAHAAPRARRCPVSGLADLRIWKTPGVGSRILFACAALAVLRLRAGC